MQERRLHEASVCTCIHWMFFILHIFVIKLINTLLTQIIKFLWFYKCLIVSEDF